MNPEKFYDKQELGENEYELYKDVHNIVEKHAELWGTNPRFVLMSAVEGLFEVYFPSITKMQQALGMIDQQIEENSERPQTVK